MEACRRILDAWRGADGQIPTEALPEVLDQIRGSLHGFDINPFACYLAEINLLIQVLDLLKQGRTTGQTLSVDRFRIFCDDALLVDEALVQLNTGLFSMDGRVSDAIKARTGAWTRGFDVIVGNPPYVRADEQAPDFLAYRGRIERQEWFATRALKWDLYVPFIERAFQLLADDSEARACLITISSLCNEPYAAPLRQLLASAATLQRIVFAEKVRLFSDAEWQDNVILVFSRGRPPDGWTVPRFRMTVDPQRSIRELPDAALPTTDVDRLFNSRPAVHLDTFGTIRLDRLCYVSKGMVLHSSERLAPGAIVTVAKEYDPTAFDEEEVECREPGFRSVVHRPFKKGQLVSPVQTALHPRAYIEPEEVYRGGTGLPAFLEYGPHTRCPELISRPTFPELYDRPKLMVGTFTGAAVDEGTPDGFLTASHSLTLAIRWCDLEGVDNRALKDARRDIQPDPSESAGYSLWYLLALFLSAPIQAWLHANKRSMKDHVYPDDLKVLPIKQASPSEQVPFIRLARERHGLWHFLAEKRREGRVEGRVGAERPRTNVRIILDRLLPKLSRVVRLVQLANTGLVTWAPGASDLRRLMAREGGIWRGKELVAEIPAHLNEREALAPIVASVLSAGSGPLSTRGAELVPGDVAGWLRLRDAVEHADAEITQAVDRRAEIDRELDTLAWEIYRARP